MTDAPTKMPPSGASEPTSAKRRAALYGGVAALAAAAGAGWAWWRLQPHAVQEQPGQPGAAATFFTQAFDTPDGGQVQATEFSGKPLLLNFWATWCPPCIAELPMLDAFLAEHGTHGWQILGLAVDQPSAVRKFLERSPVAFPVGMAGLEGTELTRSLGNLVGGLPFTVVFDAKGQIRHRKMGQLKPEDLREWAATIT